MAINLPFKVGGAALTMPQHTIIAGTTIIKSAAVILSNSTESAFYNSIELDHTALGFDAATLSHAADTTEQTIVDLTSQSGVLTNVISPRIATASSTMTIRVTIDGNLTIFTDVLVLANSHILVLGDTLRTNPKTGISSVNTYGSAGDRGWEATQELFIMNPAQVIERGLHGMPFDDSCKVTIQGSNNLTASSASHKAVATFSLTKPEGL